MKNNQGVYLSMVLMTIGLIVIILLSHDLFCFVSCVNFDFKITDGNKNSIRFVFNHLDWDGKRGFDFIFDGTESKYLFLNQRSKAKREIVFVSPEKSVVGLASSFVCVCMSYLKSMGLATPFRASVLVSMRHKLKDAFQKGNFLSLVNFMFDPTDSMLTNSTNMTQAIERAKQDDAIKMPPFKMISRCYNSKVIFNSWKCGTNSIYIVPEFFSCKSPFRIRKNPLKLVTFARCPEGWYIRAITTML